MYIYDESGSLLKKRSNGIMIGYRALKRQYFEAKGYTMSNSLDKLMNEFALREKIFLKRE